MEIIPKDKLNAEDVRELTERLLREALSLQAEGYKITTGMVLNVLLKAAIEKRSIEAVCADLVEVVDGRSAKKAQQRYRRRFGIESSTAKWVSFALTPTRLTRLCAFSIWPALYCCSMSGLFCAAFAPALLLKGHFAWISTVFDALVLSPFFDALSNNPLEPPIQFRSILGSSNRDSLRLLNSSGKHAQQLLGFRRIWRTSAVE